jgi:hypothetical protein
LALTAVEIQDLLELKSGESETLEFKSELPALSDKGKAEFLKDVCAMANASGGAILFGIAEVDGCAESLSLDTIDDRDAIIRRLAQLVHSNIEPSLNVNFQFFELEQGQVFAVEVPSSLSGPHRFKFNEKYRFVRRYERHIADLTYEQLREAFGASSSRLRLINSWWGSVDPQAYFPRPLMPGASMRCALTPVLYDGFTTILDPKKVEQQWTHLLLSRYGGGSKSFNYYGLSAYPGGNSGEVRAFSQAERVGPVWSWRALESFNYTEGSKFYGAWFVDFIRDSFRTQKRIFATQGIRGSFIFHAAMNEMSGWTMKTVESHGFEEEHAGSIPQIEIGPVFINDLDQVDENSAGLFSQVADRVWQAYGLASCPTKLLTESV